MATAEHETTEPIEADEATDAEAPAEAEKPKKAKKAGKKLKLKSDKPKKGKKEKAEKAEGEEKPKKAKKKAEKADGEEKPKKAKKPAGEKLTLKGPQMKRGMAMNKWEKWLCQHFEELEEGAEVHNAKLTEAIEPYVKEQGGPEDARRVILNSVRRLVGDGWITRSSRGSYKLTDKVAKLASEKEAIATKVKEAREKLNWSTQDIADFLGHPSRGRYGTLEQGRRPMHIWEAHALSRALGISIP